MVVNWKPFLNTLAAIAAAAAVIALAQHAWLKAGSALCLLVAALAFQRSLHSHSTRWRNFTWILVALAVVLYMSGYAIA